MRRLLLRATAVLLLAPPAVATQPGPVGPASAVVPGPYGVRLRAPAQRTPCAAGGPMRVDVSVRYELFVGRRDVPHDHQSVVFRTHGCERARSHRRPHARAPTCR